MKRTVTLFYSFLLSISVFAQSTQNYSFFAGAVGSLTDMSGSTTLIGPDVNGFSTQANANINLPADFRFLMLGINFFASQINISTSGAINMTNTFEDQSLFWPTTNRIGAFNTLPNARMGTSTSGKVHYKITGTQPNRVLVIEFLNMSFSASPGIADITYQVRLYESSGIIDFVYGEMRNSSGSTLTAEIGFGSGNNINQFCSVNKENEQSSTTTMHQNVIEEGTIGGLHYTNPNNRMIYRFTPLRPNSPGNLSIASSNSGQQTLMIMPANDNPGYRYFVYRSTAESGPYGFIGIATGTTFVSTNLAPSSTYYYQVFSGAEGALGIFPATTSGNTTAVMNIQSTAIGGNWIEPTTWIGGIVPSQNDNANIQGGATVTITTSVACSTLSVLGQLEYAGANTQLAVNGNVFIANTGSIRANGSGIRNFVIRDGDLTNNGNLEFCDAANEIIFELANTNRIFNGTGNIVGTNATGTPANTGIIRRFTVNRINNTFTDPVYLTIHQPFIISENLNLYFGFIENLSNLYFDNTAVAPGKDVSANVAVTHAGSPYSGIMGNVAFGPNATYNLNYTGSNATGIVTTGKEMPQNFAINNLSVDNNFGITVTHDIQAINITGSFLSPIFYGSHQITVGKNTTMPGQNIGVPIYGTGPVTRWYGTQSVTAGAVLGNFPFRFGNPDSYKNRLANISPVNGATSGGTITIRHFDIPGQSDFSQPFFDNSIGYVRRSNSYWQVSTGNGLVANDVEIRFFTESLSTPEPFMNYPTANITLANTVAPGTFLEAIPRLPGYPIIRRTLNSASLNNNFYFGEADPLLPIKLVTLKGQIQSGQALLTWETRQEVGVSHFEVERSFNGNQFTYVGRVKATSAQQENRYAFKDVKIPIGSNYYRLKIVDYDGTIVYSQVLKLQYVSQPENKLYDVYPNPARAQTAIRYQLATTSNISIILTDLSGRQTILAQYHQQPAGLYIEHLDIKSKTYAAGKYQIRMIVTNQQGKATYEQSTPIIIH